MGLSQISSETKINSNKPEVNAKNNALDNVQPINLKTFPNQPVPGSNQNLATIANIQHLLDSYGITVRYNIIRKKLSITLPGYSGTPDNTDSVALTHIISLATLNGLATGQIASYIEVLGDRNPYNPIADWIISNPWDGKDRLQAIYDTLTEREDYPTELKRKLIYRWMLSAVAAALKSNGFKARGVLTLQGPQSIGKTSWINSLVPDLILRENAIKLDHHLDAGNKDSLLTAISHWIVEIGELDSSFKKDIARLKGFLTSDHDKVRRPYGKANSEYPRRTVFCATVNDNNFLVDLTGNSRWWTIPVTRVNFTHGIDMQQLYAQLAIGFNKGEQWWLTQDEENLLELHNRNHRVFSAIRERILEVVDFDLTSNSHLPAMTPIEILREIGIAHPSNSQCKECAAVLREYFGESKRINGQNKWRIPLKAQNKFSSLEQFTPPKDELIY